MLAGMLSPSGWLSAALAVLALLAPAGAQDRMAELKAEYDRAGDPVHKARALAKLGTAQMDKVREEANAGEAERALRILQQYRDEVNAVTAALAATGINAEKHSNGFKQLQICVREAIRRLNDIAFSLPFEQRDPFEAIRNELEGINKRLVHELFPRQSGSENLKR
jgi:hypothetical protein